VPADPHAAVETRLRYIVAGAVAALAGAFAAVQLRHGVVPMLDTASYWSGIEATSQGHPFTTTLAPSFSNFDVLQVLQRNGRLPFVDFPVGYPLLAGLVALIAGARGAMVLTIVTAVGLMVFVAVAGPRTRPVAARALAVRAVIALGVVALPVFRLTTQGALSEPLFCAAAVCLICALIEYHDGGRSWVLPALLISACGLLRFVGAALVVLLVLEMVRRRESIRLIAAAVVVAVVPTASNIVWASAAGGGHTAGWRGLDRRDLNTVARSIGGWFDSTLGDLRQTYFAADRSLPWWVPVVVAAWLGLVALAAWSLAAGSIAREAADRPLPVVRRSLPTEVTIGLSAAGVLVAALVAGMAGFDALVIADNRLMLPIGALTATAIGWSLRPASTATLGLTVAAALVWIAVATAPTAWTESFSTPGPRALVDPAVLPNGRPVRVVLTNDADTIHWASGLPTAYMPTATNSLTGEAVDAARIYDALPCALAQHDGLVIISAASLFGPGDLEALQRLVDEGRLIPLPSRLGEAYVAAPSCGAP
jgi:hypothetical protein